MSPRDPKPATVFALGHPSVFLPGASPRHTRRFQVEGWPKKSFRKPYQKIVALPTKASHLETNIQLAPGGRRYLLGERLRVIHVPSSPALPLGALQPQCTPPPTAPTLTPASSPDRPLPFSQTPLLLSGSHPNTPALPPRGFLRARGAMGGVGLGGAVPRALPATEGRCLSAAAKARRGRLCGTARGWRGAGAGRARPGM